MSRRAEEMREKWCPMARLRANDGAYNRVISADEGSDNKMIYGHSLCIAGLCAMWEPDKQDEALGDCGLKSSVK